MGCRHAPFVKSSRGELLGSCPGMTVDDAQARFHHVIVSGGQPSPRLCLHTSTPCSGLRLYSGLQLVDSIHLASVHPLGQ